MPSAAGMYYNFSDLGPPGSIPLILIHGAGGSYLGWHNHLRRMAGITIYALDLPGHGKSFGEGRHSLEAYADDVLTFMQETNIYQAVLAGHSLGGMIALQTALQEPERVAGLVIVCSGAACPIPTNVIQGLLNPLTVPQSMNWLAERLESGADDGHWAKATIRAVRETRRGVLYGDLLACQAAELAGQVDEITARTLVCYAEADRFFLPQASIYLANLMPNAQLASFTNCGHLLPLEQPDGLAELIRSEFFSPE
jgi:pimeloyl-ACP methyl ester carboxylesterase